MIAECLNYEYVIHCKHLYPLQLSGIHCKLSAVTWKPNLSENATQTEKFSWK